MGKSDAIPIPKQIIIAALQVFSHCKPTKRAYLQSIMSVDSRIICLWLHTSLAQSPRAGVPDPLSAPSKGVAEAEEEGDRSLGRPTADERILDTHISCSRGQFLETLWNHFPADGGTPDKRHGLLFVYRQGADQASLLYAINKLVP